MSNSVAVISGGSRGVGREIALEFARHGQNVAILYAGDTEAAHQTRDELSAIGRGLTHLVIQADITSDQDREMAFNKIADKYRGISHLTLAASGGLELGKPKDYAELINNHAQVAMVGAAQSLWVTEELATIEFLTSHQAWYLGEKLVGKDGESYPIGSWENINRKYEKIAISKHNGIQALTSLYAQGGIVGARLLIASTDLIPDSQVALAATGSPRFKDEAAEQGLSNDERRRSRLPALVAARKLELENLRLDSTLYLTADFAAATVARALNNKWAGVGYVLLPDHLEQDTFLKRP